MKNKLVIRENFDVRKQLSGMYDVRLKIGYPIESDETFSERDGISALDKAVIHNFGLGGNPKRPFMDRAFFDNEQKYRSLMKKAFSNIGNMNFIEVINKLGLVGANDVKSKIINYPWKKNSQATINAKGSSKPLIDTSHMLQSITYQIVED